MGSLIIGPWGPGKRQVSRREMASPMDENILVGASAGASEGYVPGETIKDSPDSPELVVIPSGIFMMGSGAYEQELAVAWGANHSLTSSETPRHRVSVCSFAAGRYTVTRGEFAAFVEATGYLTEAEWRFQHFPEGNPDNYNWYDPGFAQDNTHPVIYVSWIDVQAYIKWVSQKSGDQYRLLSEAEWEYAARGGNETAFWWGNSISTADANYDGDFSYPGSPIGQTLKATVPVFCFNPNPYGLYNVHGNVWEFVGDSWAYNYLHASPYGSARPRYEGDGFVLRGGSWRSRPAEVRSASRFNFGGLPGCSASQNDVGFRLARNLF